MSVTIRCPHCGPRPSPEFVYGGEWRDLDAGDEAADFERVFLRDNVAGPQRERWFHAFGCRRWTTVTRDTVTQRT